MGCKRRDLTTQYCTRLSPLRMHAPANLSVPDKRFRRHITTATTTRIRCRALPLRLELLTVVLLSERCCLGVHWCRHRCRLPLGLGLGLGLRWGLG